MKNTLLTMVIGLFYSSMFFAQDHIAGAEVYNLNCARCHQARPTHEFSDREWDVIVPHMRERAHLTKTESDVLTAFLQSSNLPETLIQASIPSDDGSDPDGKSLVTQFACVGCHVVGKTGGKIGPSLDDVFSRRDEAFILKKLTNPQFNNPSSAMPKLPLTPKQREAITTYLKSIQ